MSRIHIRGWRRRAEWPSLVRRKYNSVDTRASKKCVVRNDRYGVRDADDRRRTRAAAHAENARAVRFGFAQDARVLRVRCVALQWRMERRGGWVVR